MCVIFTSVLSTAIAQTNNCDTKLAQCKEAVDIVSKKCDRAIEEKNKALSLADLAIQNCQKTSMSLTNENKELNRQLDVWYRNPFLVSALAGGLGILTGFVGYYYLSHTVR